MELKEYKRGFRYFECNPPDAIKEYDEYQNTEFLRICARETKDQKKWIKELPFLANVRILWVDSNVNQQMFDAICNMSNLISLSIGATTIKNMDTLSKLESLYLFGITKVDNIDVLATLKGLKVLCIENIKKIERFDILSNLINLEQLNIDGSMWTAQKIDNFEFVSKLTNLKYLSFVNTKANIKDFTPLLKLTKLIGFHCSLNYALEEFEKLQQLPNL